MSVKYPRLSGVANSRFNDEQDIDDEDESDELSNRVHKSRGGAMSIITNPGQNIKVNVSDEALSQLKSVVRDEHIKNHEIEKQLVDMKWKVMKLNRRLQDMSYVHEQERTKSGFEINIKDIKIIELRTNFKVMQELQYENHRMEKEKCALLLVIDEMSRSYLQYY